MANFTAIFFLLFSTSVSLGNCLTRAQYDTAYNNLQKFFRENNTKVLPTAVRLAFHDSVGGSDGCIEITNVDNFGLEGPIDALEPLYNSTYITQMSRADFWVIAALAAIGEGIKNANKFCQSKENATDCPVPELNAKFRFGRKDCPTSPHTTVHQDLPSPKASANDTFHFFARVFNFTERETTAAIGVHSMGSADPGDSGYSGFWLADQSKRFDNSIYKLMVDKNIKWQPENRAGEGKDPKWQFFGHNVNDKREVGMMLNTDFEIYYDLMLDKEAKAVCDVQTDCPKFETFDIAREFANNVTLWVDEFRLAYTKMLENGQTNLKELE